MKQVFKKWQEQYFSNEEAVLLALMLAVALVVATTLGAVLGPVFTAMILAFLLQGLVNLLTRRGVPLRLAITISFTLFFVGFVSVLVVLIPIVGRQTSLFIAELPNMLGRIRDLLITLPEKYAEYVSPEQFQIIVARASEEAASLAEQILRLSISSFPGLFGILLYLFLVPMLVFFMLKDKDVLINFVSGLLPTERSVMTAIWSEMDIQFANYVRGKAIEILIVGVTSYFAFLILGLNYAALLAPQCID